MIKIVWLNWLGFHPPTGVTGRKAVTIGRWTAGLVQNGMVTAAASWIFLKSTGEIFS
jgi:hypothetical protein